MPPMKLHFVEMAPRVPGLDRTLVLLHGFGADEHDLLPLAEELDPRLRVVSLQAPIALDFGGRAWFNLEQRPEGFAFDPREVAEGVRFATEAVEQIAADSPRPILCGFSQGAGMALSVALTRPELTPAVIVFSGVPARVEPAPADRLLGLRAFVAHGQYDPLLPVKIGQRTRDILRNAGVDVTYREYPMGHMVIPAEVADAHDWLAASLA
jgi:phospholipase/carboxylesterase